MTRPRCLRTETAPTNSSHGRIASRRQLRDSRHRWRQRFRIPGRPTGRRSTKRSGAVLKNVDHFATPESFDFVDAVLEFLDAIPT